MTQAEAVKAIEFIGATASVKQGMIIVSFPKGTQTSIHEKGGQYLINDLARAVFIVAQCQGMIYERNAVKEAAQKLFEKLGLND